jgi:hypothetical protein
VSRIPGCSLDDLTDAMANGSWPDAGGRQLRIMFQGDRYPCRRAITTVSQISASLHVPSAASPLLGRRHVSLKRVPGLEVGIMSTLL